MESIKVCQKVFEISANAFFEVKFNNVFKEEKLNRKFHQDEVYFREQNLVDALLELNKAKGKHLALK